jgi:hypothetical protein
MKNWIVGHNLTSEPLRPTQSFVLWEEACAFLHKEIVDAALEADGRAPQGKGTEDSALFLSFSLISRLDQDLSPQESFSLALEDDEKGTLLFWLMSLDNYQRIEDERER